MNTEAKPALNATIVAGVRVALATLRVLFAVVRAIPAPDRIVFLSRQSNGPTPDIAALTEEIQRDNPDARLIVLARKMRSNRDIGYFFHLIRQVWHLAHSTTVVLDSYSLLTSNGIVRPDARVIQMWHAIGSFKKFGWNDLDATNPRRAQLADVLHMHAGNTTVIASSERAADHFAGAFNVGRERVVVSPLPRVDRLRSDGDWATAKRAEVRRRELDEDSSRVLLVAPTLRSVLEHQSTEFLESIATRDWTVWLSLHPVSDPRERTFGTDELLAAADAFVTDKSSMIYEAGLLGIPGFLWVPREHQNALFAESYPTVDELRPLIVESVDELIEALGDPDRRGAAADFAARYVEIDPSETATARLARIITNS